MRLEFRHEEALLVGNKACHNRNVIECAVAESVERRFRDDCAVDRWEDDNVTKNRRLMIKDLLDVECTETFRRGPCRHSRPTWANCTPSLRDAAGVTTWMLVPLSLMAF